jgi:hypothetical protein
VPADADAEAKLANARRTAFRAAAGIAYERVSSVPVTGGLLRLAVGGQNDFVGHYASLSIMTGLTENGLRTWDVRVGWTGDLLRADRVRLGMDADLGYLVIRRATVDSRMWALGAGVGIHASADLYTFGPRDAHAITLEGRLDGRLYFGGATTWGPSLLGGIRY